MRGGNGSIQLTPEQALEILHKFGLAPVSTNNASAFEAKQSSPTAVATGTEGPFGNTLYNTYASSNIDGRYTLGDDLLREQAISGFSPFSPDPNYLASIAAEREAANPSLGEGLARNFAAFGQHFIPLQQHSTENVPSTLDRLSPSTGSGASARSITPSQGQKQAQDTFGFALNKAAQPFSLNRAPGRPSAEELSRPNSTKATDLNDRDKGQAHLHDLNGTFASLNLDASGAVNTAKSQSDRSDNANGSVQLKMAKTGSVSPVI